MKCDNCGKEFAEDCCERCGISLCDECASQHECEEDIK